MMMLLVLMYGLCWNSFVEDEYFLSSISLARSRKSSSPRSARNRRVNRRRKTTL